MKLKKGDFIKLDYVGRVKATNKIFDLTDEKVAIKEGIYDKKTKYGAATVVVGAKHLVKGLDDQLLEKEIGKDYTLTVFAEEGFGERSGELIKVFHKNKFRDHEGPLFPGSRVQLQGMPGTVTSVSGGRIRVDFNHPLAGKDLVYKIKIHSKISSKKDQVQALLDLHAPFPGFKAKVTEKSATITVPNAMPPQWFQVQPRVANEIIELVGLNDVKFVQEYKKPKKASKSSGKKDK